MKKIILWSFSFVLLSLNAVASFALTENDILYHSRMGIYDSTATYRNPTLTNPEILSVANIIQSEIVAYTKCISSRSLTSPVTHQMEYDLPTDYVDIIRVAFTHESVTTTGASTTTYRRLESRTIDQLDEEFPSWDSNSTSTSGLPGYYYLRENKIGLYPKPSGTYTQVNALKIDYYKTANNMSSATDEPYNGIYQLREFHHIIILGTVSWCRNILGLDNTRVSAEYRMWLDLMKDKIKNKEDSGGVIETYKEYYGGGVVK